MTDIVPDTTPPPPDAGKLADRIEKIPLCYGVRFDGEPTEYLQLRSDGNYTNIDRADRDLIVAALRADRATPPVSDAQMARAVGDPFDDPTYWLLSAVPQAPAELTSGEPQAPEKKEGDQS